VQVIDGAAGLPQTYAITDMCRVYAVTSRALRHYEALGLLAPRRRGRQRIYDEAQRDLIELIVRWRTWRLPLSKIRRLLDLRQRQAHDPEARRRTRDLLAAHLVHLRGEQASLAAVVAAAEAELRDLERVPTRDHGAPPRVDQAHFASAAARRATT